MCLCLFMGIWQGMLSVAPGADGAQQFQPGRGVGLYWAMVAVVSEPWLKRSCVRRVPVPWKQEDVFVYMCQHAPLGSAGLGTACAGTARAVAQYRHTRSWQKGILLRTA